MLAQYATIREMETQSHHTAGLARSQVEQTRLDSTGFNGNALFCGKDREEFHADETDGTQIGNAVPPHPKWKRFNAKNAKNAKRRRMRRWDPFRQPICSLQSAYYS